MAGWRKHFDRALEQVERGLETVADEAVRVAGEARKVAGIGIGTIELDLVQRQFRAGQTITGTAIVKMTEPTPASRVAIRLRATRDRFETQRRNGSRVRVRRTEQLYDYSCDLAAQGTYHRQSLPFAVHIPEALEERIEVDGVLGDVLKFAEGVRSLSTTPVSWKLSVFVEIPWKRNLTKTIDLVVE